MAFLQTIRTKYSWLLLGGVGIAMLAFILMDLMNSGSSILTRDANTIMEINGERVSVQEFSNRLQTRIDNYISQSGDRALEQVTRGQLQDLVYDNILKERLMGAQYDELGLTITGNELWERIIRNPSVTQVQIFQNEQGQFDPNLVRQYLAALKEQRATNPDAQTEWENWLDFEEDLKTQQIEQNYYMLIRSGIYATSQEGKWQYEARNGSRSITYIYKPYASIIDSTVEVSESELKSYYSEHKEDMFKQDASRDVEFVAFNVAPSAADMDAAREEFNTLLNDEIRFNEQTNSNDTLFGFRNTDNDSVFVNSNSDQSRYTGAYVFEGDMPEEYDSLMFQNEPGYVYGPFMDGDLIKAVKLVEKSTLPDSVKASHILIAYTGAMRAAETVTRTREEASAYADSLFEVVKADTANFADYAMTNSDGPSSTEGGELGWFTQGMMTPKFQNYAFENGVGDIGLVETEFGFHIIRITDQTERKPAVKVATLDRRIYPSEATEDEIYNNAQQVATAGTQSVEEFRAKAQSFGRSVRPATNLTEGAENLPGLPNSRDLVRWTFADDRSVGDVQVFEVEDQIVAVYVGAIREEGYATFESVKERIRTEVVKEKKAEMLSSELAAASGTTMEEKAQSLGIQVQTFANAKFNSPTIQGVGMEPKVIGTVFGMEQGAMSEPIAGESGVMIVQVNAITPAPEEASYATEANQLRQQMIGQVSVKVFQTIKDEAEVIDRRAKFY